MRLFIISDIHGRLDTLKKALEAERDFKSDDIVILGDVLYHGPRNDIPPAYRPKEAIQALDSIKDKIIAVRGNCDAEVDQMVLPFDLSKDVRRIFDKDNNRLIRIEHGHHLLGKERGKESLVFYGHTHIPAIEEREGLLLLNPGSISIPKNGYKESYATYDGSSLKIIELFSGKTIMERNL